MSANGNVTDVRRGSCSGEGWGGGGEHHPRIERAILRVAIRGGELAAHEHYVAAVAEHITGRHSHGGVAAVRIAHEHHSRTAGRLGWQRIEIVILDGRALQGIGEEDARGLGGARGVALSLPERPETVEHGAVATAAGAAAAGERKSRGT
jgi:hypothetical protein